MASLEVLKKQIEALNENRQSDILEVFIKHNVVVTENNNGSFINLTLVKDECLAEINKYLSYVEIQENDLMKDEMEKDQYKSDFFTDKEI